MISASLCVAIAALLLAIGAGVLAGLAYWDHPNDTAEERVSIRTGRPRSTVRHVSDAATVTVSSSKEIADIGSTAFNVFASYTVPENVAATTYLAQVDFTLTLSFNMAVTKNGDVWEVYLADYDGTTIVEIPAVDQVAVFEFELGGMTIHESRSVLEVIDKTGRPMGAPSGVDIGTYSQKFVFSHLPFNGAVVNNGQPLSLKARLVRFCGQRNNPKYTMNIVPSENSLTLHDVIE